MAKSPDPAANSAPEPSQPGANKPADTGRANTPETKPAPLDEAIAAQLPAEPLPDGTVPTVLAPGDGHKSVGKSRASLTRIYRRADIMTTLYTFIGIVIAGATVVGVYWYLTRSNVKPTTTAPVTKLDQTELTKLGAFFSGNTAGSTDQILTVSAASLFNGRVAIASDLKVTGGTQVTGTTALGDLTVDKTSTLGVTNVRGSLTVGGPLNLQSPAIFGAGISVNGNLATTGNGTFGGSLSAGTINVPTLNVSGTLNLSGHLAIAGQTPSVAPASEAGSGANANVEGNDSAGSISINTGTIPGHIGNQGGLLVSLTFKTAYTRTPRILITPVGQSGAALMPYVLKTSTGFTIGIANDAISNKSYAFDYWVVQ